MSAYDMIVHLGELYQEQARHESFGVPKKGHASIVKGGTLEVQFPTVP